MLFLTQVMTEPVEGPRLLGVKVGLARALLQAAQVLPQIFHEQAQVLLPTYVRPYTLQALSYHHGSSSYKQPGLD